MSPNSLFAARCRGQYYPRDLIQDSSPAMAQWLQEYLQAEIDEMLAAVEFERQQEQCLALTWAELASAKDRRLRFDRAPFGREDLPCMINDVQRLPDFRGRTAFDLYALVAAQLDGEAFNC